MPRQVKYAGELPIVAMCYDFDKTLSPKDMQDFALIPKLGKSPDEFWSETAQFSKREGVDKILAYMRMIVEKMNAAKLKITEHDFNKLGSSIELFPGVDSWFERIDRIAAQVGVHVEHYIISAGLKEIIQGTPIADNFTEIYASSFLYDEYGRPVWPRQVVNYTTKTQYLFRISKDCLDLSDEDSVNEYIDDRERRIPFANFIYIGDSETDIPAMKIVKQGGGTSIGVYNPDSVNIDKVSKLIKQDRIDYLTPALYCEGGSLEAIVRDTLVAIKAKHTLKRLTQRHQNAVDLLGALDGALGELEAKIPKATREQLSDLRAKAKRAVERSMKSVAEEGVFSEYETAKIAEAKFAAFCAKLSARREQLKAAQRP